MINEYQVPCPDCGETLISEADQNGDVLLDCTECGYTEMVREEDL